MDAPHISQSDCLDYLKTLPSASVDYVLIDPPYAIGAATWDRYSDEEYLIWAKEWVTESVRVLKPTGFFTVFGTLKKDGFLRLRTELLSKTGMICQTPIHWSYNWGGRTKRNFPQKLETAWCYSMGPGFTFNPIYVPRKMLKNIRTGKAFEHGTIPTSVWQHNLHTTSKEYLDTKFHPTPKPMFIIERLIAAYTNPSETVLDFFAGSGTTAVACKRLGRAFLGCDTHSDYVFLANNRIKNA